MITKYTSVRSILRIAINTFVLLLLTPMTAWAQLEEIVVTAQKRAESLQDVPIAISSFTGETLRALGVTDATDLVALTPGLSSGTQGGSNRNYFLRGVGTNDFHLTAAAAVGQYSDGVTLTSGFHARTALFDIERVEVLKGPQNTLFGLNTTGGAINYISSKPVVGAGTNGSLSVKFGSDSLVNSEVAVGFDITDNLAARLAVQTNEEDGAFRSVTNGTLYGGDDAQAYRASLLWEPGSRASVLLNLHGSESENDGAAVKALGTRAPDGSNNRCADFSNTVQNFESNTNCLSRDGGGLGLAAQDPSTGDWETVTQTYGDEDISTKGFFLNVDYDFGWATLTSLTAFDNIDLLTATDQDGTATFGAHIVQEDDRDTFQQEVRLVSNGDGPYRWIVGAYYLDEDAESYTAVRAPGLNFANGLRWLNVQVDHTKENVGVYYQGEYDFTDTLTLTGGVRWSDEEIVANYLPSIPDVSGLDLNAQLSAADVNALVAAQNPGIPGFDSNGFQIARQVQQTLPNDDIGYTVKLDWKVSDESLVYLSFSEGFKGSAADVRAVFSAVPIPNIAAGLENSRLEPESLQAWELGYKSSFWGNRIQFDAAIFTYDYENLQQFITPGGVPQLDNAPESEINGLDANLKYASDSGFYLQVGLSVLDTEVTDARGSAFVEGAELASSPEYTLLLLAAQDFKLRNGATLTLAANATRTGDAVKTTLTQGTSQVADLFTVPAYTVANANVTYRFGDAQQYAFSLFAKNLTDEHYCDNIGVSDGNLVLADGVNPFGVDFVVSCKVTNASTRTYGASFGFEF